MESRYSDEISDTFFIIDVNFGKGMYIPAGAY
ncbi:unknown [Lactobacillus amylovorus CAG:719]|nr:unknown [Lactobacillus amylovorus CAG:719]